MQVSRSLKLNEIPKDAIERFWKYTNKTKKSKCWLWSGTTRRGYGIVQWYENHSHRFVQAHKVSFVIHNGKILKHMCICHTCDNKLCVNPEHLFLGTQQDNMDDKVDKNRQARNVGEKSGTAKLTEKDIKEIRRLYSTGAYSQRKLARIYGVWQTQIGNITRREQWQHV